MYLVGIVAVGVPLPVCGLDAGDVDAEVLALLHRDHLRGGLKAELLHHRFEVVLTRTLWRKRWREKKRDYKSNVMRGEALFELDSFYRGRSCKVIFTCCVCNSSGPFILDRGSLSFPHIIALSPGVKCHESHSAGCQKHNAITLRRCQFKLD